jgi:hypothetical protein
MSSEIFQGIRDAMSKFDVSSNIKPNEEITTDRVLFPNSHRQVLDFGRQLIIGNRGMGKSFWAHALKNPEISAKLATAYNMPTLNNTKVAIGFNGSTSTDGVTPTRDNIKNAFAKYKDSDLIWKAVLMQATYYLTETENAKKLPEIIEELQLNPDLFSERLTQADNILIKQQKYLIIVFDALDRLADNWEDIQKLSKSLLKKALDLQSFRAIRTKIFMRVDQFEDVELFKFPDSSKIKSEHVDLTWHPKELYGLLFFEILRKDNGNSLKELSNSVNADKSLPINGVLDSNLIAEQTSLVNAIVSEFIGKGRKSGRVYTWIPKHLSDAKNSCSPRTFLTAWKTAAEHQPSSRVRAIDHLGLKDGVRKASGFRLDELKEDYIWIDKALEPLSHKLVPMTREDLFALWKEKNTIENILKYSQEKDSLVPIGLVDNKTPEALLKTMSSIAVMEERSNGKINVPDIFRLGAKIGRKGGVAVPRRS